MAGIVLFHSVLGLRDAERLAADRWRAAGNDVVTPDLFAGRTATTLAEGVALKDESVGWATIEQRARDAVEALPPTTVLAGVSMGAGVVQSLLPDRPGTAGVLLLHGLADLPATVRRGLPVQLHVADDDPIFPPEEVGAWRERASRAGAEVAVFTYPDAGHYFTDPDLPDHAPRASAQVAERVVAFLATLRADGIP